jgi:phosphohistidine phosphatase
MAAAHELYLIRHGIAEERGDAWPDDTKRPLTKEGIDRLKKEARGLASIGVTFDIVLTSPLVRAKQTAEAIASAFNAKPSIVTIESLAPGASHQAILADLEKHARRKRLALVGHEPGLGEFVARLIGARRPVELKKGAVCRVDIEALPPGGPGALRWLLTPKMLRNLK